MNTELINKITNRYTNKSYDVFNVGDTVEVDNIIRDGDKKRVQKFKGLVISIKGKGVSKSFTVRKISYGVGVEKTFPLFSPNVADVKVIRYGKPRRSKLYFLRNRVGKRALKVNERTNYKGPKRVEAKVAKPQKEAASDSSDAAAE